jgi:4-oxalocrotonate tautomerase
VLRERRDLTAVTIDFVDPAHWWIGGRSLQSLGLDGFYFDIRIVDGSNTKDEKARYLHVRDVRADAYGYGGLTQEHEYVATSLAENEGRKVMTSN